MPPQVILDTNVFVAAGFRAGSCTARIVQAVRRGQLELVWNEATRRETRHILHKIPRLSWEDVAGLFVESNGYRGEVFVERFEAISDPDDRKFTALAEATGAALLTNDRGLLRQRDALQLPILTPHEYCHRKPPTRVGGP